MIKTLHSLLFTLIFLPLTTSGQLRSQRIVDPIPSEVNIMYQKGLQFLINNQNEDGYWSDSMGREPAVVGFALLAVLAGDFHAARTNKEFQDKCLNYIISEQDASSGYIGNSMYNHGFCTLALAEAYGHLHHKDLGKSLEKAVNLILAAQAQNPSQAWRYTPDSLDADSTVTGCQIVALLAARNAGISVPDESLSKALAYMETCRTKDGAYGYTDGFNGKPTLSAIALLSHFLIHREATEDSEETLEYLKKRLNYKDQHYPFYYEYYMSQALFQAAPETWADWNRKNIRYLKITQAQDGSWKGNHGEAYSTSAALLSLALNYRYMPIYERF